MGECDEMESHSDETDLLMDHISHQLRPRKLVALFVIFCSSGEDILFNYQPCCFGSCLSCFSSFFSYDLLPLQSHCFAYLSLICSLLLYKEEFPLCVSILSSLSFFPVHPPPPPMFLSLPHSSTIEEQMLRGRGTGYPYRHSITIDRKTREGRRHGTACQRKGTEITIKPLHPSVHPSIYCHSAFLLTNYFSSALACSQNNCILDFIYFRNFLL